MALRPCREPETLRSYPDGSCRQYKPWERSTKLEPGIGKDKHSLERRILPMEPSIRSQSHINQVIAELC